MFAVCQKRRSNLSTFGYNFLPPSSAFLSISLPSPPHLQHPALLPPEPFHHQPVLVNSDDRVSADTGGGLENRREVQVVDPGGGRQVVPPRVSVPRERRLHHVAVLARHRQNLLVVKREAHGAAGGRVEGLVGEEDGAVAGEAGRGQLGGEPGELGGTDAAVERHEAPIGALETNGRVGRAERVVGIVGGEEGLG